MTDQPTPEERADTLANTECPHWSEAVPYTCKSECPCCVGKEIRAAVGAEREEILLMADRFDFIDEYAAAIRARGESDDA
jgi:hypothetical protein